MAEYVTPRTYPIWFIDDGTKDPRIGNLLEATFNSMRRMGFNVKWSNPKECLRIQRDELMMFVTVNFSGPVFEHLLSLGCRIVGPLCLYACIRDTEEFPGRSHPVYSTAMKDIVVCCTMLTPSERAAIHQKVEFMYGSYSGDLTKKVTHLICGEVGSKKYYVAASFKLPIMDPQWVEETWNNSQHQFIHGSSLPYEDFRCPIFKGLTITVSQLSSEDRDFIKDEVEQEGGRYISSLEMDETTHLVLLEPKGEKYKYAKEWYIFCVHEDWFYDSLEAGYCMDENLYPPKDEETLETSESMITDCSNVVEESVDLETSTSTSTSSQSPIKMEFPSLEMLDSFSLTSLPKYGDFLDACNIYLSDFSDSHMKKLIKIINAGGGNRFSIYGDCVSHVVCGKKNSEVIDLIKTISNRPHVVSFDWLLQCCKAGRLIDETPFSCMEKTPLTPENETISRKAKNVKHSQSEYSESQKSESLCDMDVVKQYLPD